MDGVVSLLDEQRYRQVENVWAELAERFGLRGVYITPFPHFTYHVAAQYDVPLLEGVLREIAARTAPFQVRTEGLGIFTSAQPVLYIPIVRSMALSRFHQMLWQEVSKAGVDIVELYHPERWMPHITIGFGDLDSARLADVVSLMSERAFTWEITIDNLALGYGSSTEQPRLARFDFGA